MANPRKRVPENVPGDFFVDSTCIDCDACRQIAPAVFGEAAETSFVKAQPGSATDRRQALQALLACPTGSIGCLGDDDVKAVMKDFPLRHRGAGLLLRLQLAEVVWRQQLLHPAPRRQLADRLAEVRHAAGAAVGGAGRHRPHLPDPPGRRGRCRALCRTFSEPPHHSSGGVVVAARCGSRPRRRRAVGVGSGISRHPHAGPHQGPLRPALPGPLPLHRRPPGLGPGRSSTLRPPRTTAGIRGRSRPSRCGGWRIIASSGCCPATARRCILPANEMRGQILRLAETMRDG